MRRLIESGAVRGKNFVQVGLRGYWPPAETFDWMDDQRMRSSMHDIWDRGVEPVLVDAIAHAADGCDALYLSVDIDVLDPGFAPGTGTPEPGGMIRPTCSRRPPDCLGAPLVGNGCGGGVTALRSCRHDLSNAHRVMLEALAGMAHKKRELAGGVVTRPGHRPDPASLRYPTQQP